MRVAFFVEGVHTWKPDRNHNNIRTDVAWAIALDAAMIGLQSTEKQIEGFLLSTFGSSKVDWGIIIVPKNKPDDYHELVSKYCNRVAVMQEGPNWFYQDYAVEDQFKYLTLLQKSDLILCHNESDVPYYNGIVDGRVHRMPSLMLPSPELKKLAASMDTSNRQGVVLGGNFVSWYGGMDSYIVGSSQFFEMSVVSMGRRKMHEENIGGLTHLEYMTWLDWMGKLSNFKYGIHLMRTHAAGTFALNCAFFGIPCIGYAGLSTQEDCHPELTVDIGNIRKAREKLKHLVSEKLFYTYCSEYSRSACATMYSEDVWVSHMNTILK